MTEADNELLITVTVESEVYPLYKSFVKSVKALNIEQVAYAIYLWFSELNGMDNPFELGVWIHVDCIGKTKTAWGKEGWEIADDILNIVEDMQDHYKVIPALVLEEFHEEFKELYAKHRI